MNLQPVTPPAGNDKQPDEVHTRLHGRWLVLVRGAWLTLVILTLGYLLRQPPGVLGTTANSLYWDSMLVHATLSWTSRGAQRDWPVSR